MYTRALAILALVYTVRSNDVIVGLKTDGTKFFDENRQANPALWRQMDNVTIKAPENEVIRRIVITDLRPEKDGDVKVVEGGEGQKNVTIELKSPTVLRGYEFHIEVFSVPEEQSNFGIGQQSTTEAAQGAKETTELKPENGSDNTSKLPEFSTDKNVPVILTKDIEVKDGERQGRNANNEASSTEGTTELTSTTLKSDISTTPTTQNTESATDSNKNSEFPNTFSTTFAPIPLNRNSNINPALPAVSGRDVTNDKDDLIPKDTPRHERDTEAEKLGKSTTEKFNLTPTNLHLFKSSTENKEASTTEVSDIKPIEEKSDENDEKEGLNAPSVHAFESRKFTSFIPSKVEHPMGPVKANDDEKLRNARDVEPKTVDSVSTTESGVSTTVDVQNAETTTPSSDECETTTTESHEEANADAAKETESANKVPIYINNRQWNQRFNPQYPSVDAPVQNDQRLTDGLKIYPAVLRDQTTMNTENKEENI